MSDLSQASISKDKDAGAPYKFGFYSAVLTALLTIITFGIAICTPPVSGPFSPIQQITYPYTDIASRFPRDYYWMYPAMVLLIIYVVFQSAINLYATGSKKIFSSISLVLSCISACILIVNYYLQVSVIQPSVINSEFDGVAILTQYNPHGIFIAAEEVGYIVMALSIAFLAWVFTEKKPVQTAIRWTAVLCFAIMMISLIMISFIYGIEREYRFECAVIAIDFISLILLGIFVGVIFRRGATACH